MAEAARLFRPLGDQHRAFGTGVLAGGSRDPIADKRHAFALKQKLQTTSIELGFDERFY